MANEDKKWPSPSNRWRSFEAEAFPVTAYRYDSRGASTINKEGFRGYNKEETYPYLDLFGDRTVFSTASQPGGEHFLKKDVSRFRANWDKIKFHKDKVVELVASAEFKFTVNEVFFEEYNVAHVYKIRTDSHRAIPFKDLSGYFGEGFDLFSADNHVYDSGVRNLFEVEISEAGFRVNAPARRSASKCQIKSTGKHIRDGYTKNDEIHIKGPISGRAINRSSVDRPLTSLGRDIKYEGGYGLDLATDLW